MPVKKQLPFFVGVGKHFLMKSENVYPPLMNSVISRMGSYSFTTPNEDFFMKRLRYGCSIYLIFGLIALFTTIDEVSNAPIST